MWQMSVMFLTLSVMAMMGGLFILLWSATGSVVDPQGWWTDETKLAMTFTIVFSVVGVLFVYEQFTLYSWRGHDDSDPHREARDERIAL